MEKSLLIRKIISTEILLLFLIFWLGTKIWYHSDRKNVLFKNIYILQASKFLFRNFYFNFIFNDVSVWSELSFERDAIR